MYEVTIFFEQLFSKTREKSVAYFCGQKMPGFYDEKLSILLISPLVACSHLEIRFFAINYFTASTMGQVALHFHTMVGLVSNLRSEILKFCGLILIVLLISFTNLCRFSIKFSHAILTL